MKVWCFDGSVVDVIVVVWKEESRRERKEENVDVNALFFYTLMSLFVYYVCRDLATRRV